MRRGARPHLSTPGGGRPGVGAHPRPRMLLLLLLLSPLLLLLHLPLLKLLNPLLLLLTRHQSLPHPSAPSPPTPRCCCSSPAISVSHTR